MNFSAPSGVSGFSASEGFSPPEGFSAPEGFSPPDGFSAAPAQDGGDPFGGSGGESARAASPAPTERTDFSSARPDTPPDTASADAPARAEEKPARTGAFPSPGGFPGAEQTGSGADWLSIALCALLLLAALFLVRRAACHNN